MATAQMRYLFSIKGGNINKFSRTEKRKKKRGIQK
jgi:hypothetical protein